MADLDKYALLLKQIQNPSDLRAQDVKTLPRICDELRHYLIDCVAETGGHLGASLGTVELTTALHFVYDTPGDLLVWDVGHQTYPHKILTGRASRMKTMRKMGGLAGFTKREDKRIRHFWCRPLKHLCQCGHVIDQQRTTSLSQTEPPDPAQQVSALWSRQQPQVP